jgi:hypothetical protein
MGFSGPTFRIPCDRGGFTNNPNIDNIDPVMMVSPTRNLNLNEGGRKPRGGTDKVNVLEVPAEPQINGVYDFTQQDGTQFIMLGTDDGKIYKDYTTAIKTGLTTGTSVYYNFEVMNDSVYVCNGSDRPQVWDGAAGTSSDLTNVPTDWSGGVGAWPKQILKHGRGNSERLWAILPNSNNIYASKLNDGSTEADFSDAEVEVIYIETGNEGGLTGMVELGEQLIVFTRTRAYIIDDTNASPTNWGYVRAPFTGGVPHHRLIVKTDNDVFCMMEDGIIFSFTTVQQAQDYKRSSITKEAFIDKWLRDNSSMSSIDEFHATYDPTLRAIKWFIKKTSSTFIDGALVYFVDRGPAEGWMIHDSASTVQPDFAGLDSFVLDVDVLASDAEIYSLSGYSCSSSALVKKATGEFKIYTGAYDGHVWELETVNKNDGDIGFYAGFRTPYIPTENPRVSKKFFRFWVITQPSGDFNLTAIPYIDNKQLSSKLLSLSGAGGTLDSFVLDTDILGGEDILEISSDIRDSGRRIAFEVFNAQINEDFFISQLMFDYKNLGSKPQ